MAGSNLQRIIQSDFGAGSQPDVARHLIGQSAVFDIVNGLLDEDGSIYRRGGATYKTVTDFGEAGRWVWDGFVEAGQRTLLATPETFGVVAADGETVLDLGGTGMAHPYPGRVIEGALFIAGPTSYIYGGSRKTTNYDSGTNNLAVTNGLKTVTKAGGGFTANVDPGMLVQLVASERAYVVTSVDSDTQITLREAYEGTTDATAEGTFYPLYEIAPSDPYYQSELFAVAGNKLCWAEKDTVHIAGLDLINGLSQPHVYEVNNFERVPEGVTVLGLDSIGDSLMIFTSAGIWTLQNLAYNIVDELGNPQWRLDNLSRDITLWGNEGITAWRDQLLVPAIDAIYSVAPGQAPTAVSPPIQSRYRDYVRKGYRPGRGTVHNQHLFLPILTSSNLTVDLLVCRLDRPIRFRNQTAFPWTRQGSHSGKVSALTVRVAPGEPPSLLAAFNGSGARLLKLDSWFTPGTTYKKEADGNIHQLAVITRDYLLANLGMGRARRLRLHYLLQSADESDPRLSLDFSTGRTRGGLTLWGNFQWGHANWNAADAGEWTPVRGEAPESDGTQPYTWHFTKRTRQIRFRIRSSDSAAKLTLRNLELFVAAAATPRH